MNQIALSGLTLAAIASLTAFIYCFFISHDVLMAFISGGVFLFVFITAIQLTPTPPKTCPHCGKDLGSKKT